MVSLPPAFRVLYVVASDRSAGAGTVTYGTAASTGGTGPGMMFPWHGNGRWVMEKTDGGSMARKRTVPEPGKFYIGKYRHEGWSCGVVMVCVGRGVDPTSSLGSFSEVMMLASSDWSAAGPMKFYDETWTWREVGRADLLLYLGWRHVYPAMEWALASPEGVWPAESHGQGAAAGYQEIRSR